MNWAETAGELIEGAERARQAGDQVAFIALTTKAAECAQIARFLSEPSLTEDELRAQGRRCGCAGTDEMCACQNMPDAATRRTWAESRYVNDPPAGHAADRPESKGASLRCRDRRADHPERY